MPFVRPLACPLRTDDERDGRSDGRWFRQGDSGADDLVARPGPRPGQARRRPSRAPAPPGPGPGAATPAAPSPVHAGACNAAARQVRVISGTGTVG